MQKANPVIIGSFVVGAVALVIIGVLVFSSGQLWKEKLKYVLYFDRSVGGLYVGAPVNFRGVKVGTVSDIVVEFDIGNEKSSVRTPVYIQLTAGGVREAGVNVESTLDAEQVVDLLVERGLRAAMQTQSPVTGQQSIELNFHPGTEPILRGYDNEVKELPTITSSFEEITQTATETAALLRNLPLKDLFFQVMGVAEEMNELLTALNQADIAATLKTTLASVHESVMGMQQLTQHLNQQVPLLTASLEQASAAAHTALEGDATLALRTLTATMHDAQKLVRKLDEQVTPLAASLKNTSRVARQVLDRAHGTLATVDGAVGDDSTLRYDIAQALEELTAAARSVRTFADALARRPEAFLYGKKGGRSR